MSFGNNSVEIPARLHHSLLLATALILSACVSSDDEYALVRYEHPETEEQIVALVKEARARRVQLRVRGSRHSVQEAIFTDGAAATETTHINVQLDRYTNIVEWDDEKNQVTVQSGCHLGRDPNNPLSTDKNGLLVQMHERGWALPDLGGITHQTVGGFVSTGSGGGSIMYDIADSIVRIRIVDGCGNVHDLAPNPADNNDESTNPFYAAGVSMGLLGVVSTVTFQCIPKFNIIGSQITAKVADSPVNLGSSGDQGLEAHLRRIPYSRLLWWPQKGVERVQIWGARRTRPGDESVTHKDGKFRPNPFKIIPEILGSNKIPQRIIHAFFNNLHYEKAPLSDFQEKIIRDFLGLFLRNGEEKFWDSWYRGIPMDDKVDDHLMPTEFTELFFDIGRSAEVMSALQDFYRGDEGMLRTGTYAVEVYAGKKSKFWLSPKYGRDSVRVDFFWFKKSKVERPDFRFYPQFWELLANFGFRFHWGKYLSDPASTTGVTYRKHQYPMWEKFLSVRAEMDPDGVFLSNYWKTHLGLNP